MSYNLQKISATLYQIIVIALIQLYQRSKKTFQRSDITVSVQWYVDGS